MWPRTLLISSTRMVVLAVIVMSAAAMVLFMSQEEVLEDDEAREALLTIPSITIIDIESSTSTLSTSSSLKSFSTPTLESWTWDFQHPSDLFREEATNDYDICGPCCVGRVNQVSATSECLRNMTDARFMVGRELFPLADTLRSIHIHNNNNPRLTIIGDSLGGQLYSLASCELARTQGVETTRRYGYNLIDTTWRMARWGWRNRVEAEYHSTFAIKQGDQNPFNATITYVRQYRPYDVGLIPHICNHSDVVVFAWGQHYRTDEKEDMEQNIGMVLQAMRMCPSTTTLIWAGGNAQHFEFRNSDTGELQNECGEYGDYDETGTTMQCGLLQDIAYEDINCYSWRSRFVERMVRNSTFMYAHRVSWKDKKQICVPQEMLASSSSMRGGGRANTPLWFIPWWEISAPFGFNHGGLDCTHLCYTPQIGSAIWDAVYQSYRMDVMVKGRRSRCEKLQKPWFVTGPQSTKDREGTIPSSSPRFAKFASNVHEDILFDHTAMLWKVHNGTGWFVGTGEEILEPITDAPSAS